ncbi:MAG: glutathione peroxidase [Wenzhouxiangella sp.]|nr:glutathione peroxidase [Wenzhouxiangella sp.]
MNRSFKLVLIALPMLVAVDAAAAVCNNLLDFSHRRLASSQEENLCEAYAGKVLLVVNTASQCGFTGQFSDLEALYQKYGEEGLVVLGFPSDDFNQELDQEADTAEVCYINYGVTFPMFATTGVKGEGANALFAALAEAEQEPRWNFTKYLIGRDGSVLESFGSRVKPLDSELEQAVAAALNAD